METKYITIPFDVQRAKRISNGEEEGKIVTRDGKEVRIVCFNVRHNNYPIVGLIDEGNYESAESFSKNGEYSIGDGELDCDLFLKVPEWTTFKDGDVLYVKTIGSETIGSDWYVFIYNENGGDKTCCYVALDCDGKLWENSNRVTSNDDISELRFATEEERKKLIDTLKASNIKIAKIYLKYFFGIEEKKECDFKPFDKVLVRDDDGVWFAGIFSHLRGDGQFFCAGGNLWEQCLPYNDQTAHLLGTSNDPE